MNHFIDIAGFCCHYKLHPPGSKKQEYCSGIAQRCVDMIYSTSIHSTDSFLHQSVRVCFLRITLKCELRDLVIDQSTLVQVPGRHQTFTFTFTFWPSSPTPYGVALSQCINSLVIGRYGNLNNTNLKSIIEDSNFGIRCEIAPGWFPSNLNNQKSTLVQAMALSFQSTGLTWTNVTPFCVALRHHYAIFNQTCAANSIFIELILS